MGVERGPRNAKSGEYVDSKRHILVPQRKSEGREHRLPLK